MGVDPGMPPPRSRAIAASPCVPAMREMAGIAGALPLYEARTGRHLSHHERNDRPGRQSCLAPDPDRSGGDERDRCVSRADRAIRDHRHPARSASAELARLRLCRLCDLSSDGQRGGAGSADTGPAACRTVGGCGAGRDPADEPCGAAHHQPAVTRPMARARGDDGHLFFGAGDWRRGDPAVQHHQARTAVFVDAGRPARGPTGCGCCAAASARPGARQPQPAVRSAAARARQRHYRAGDGGSLCPHPHNAGIGAGADAAA